MSVHINFELSDSDLEHFCDVMKRCRESCPAVPAEQIIENAQQLLSQVGKSDAKDFILERISQLDTLIGMLEDTDWHLADDDRASADRPVLFFPSC